MSFAVKTLFTVTVQILLSHPVDDAVIVICSLGFVMVDAAVTIPSSTVAISSLELFQWIVPVVPFNVAGIVNDIPVFNSIDSGTPTILGTFGSISPHVIVPPSNTTFPSNSKSVVYIVIVPPVIALKSLASILPVEVTDIVAFPTCLLAPYLLYNSCTTIFPTYFEEFEASMLLFSTYAPSYPFVCAFIAVSCTSSFASPIAFFWLASFAFAGAESLPVKALIVTPC